MRNGAPSTLSQEPPRWPRDLGSQTCGRACGRGGAVSPACAARGTTERRKSRASAARCVRVRAMALERASWRRRGAGRRQTVTHQYLSERFRTCTSGRAEPHSSASASSVALSCAVRPVAAGEAPGASGSTCRAAGCLVSSSRPGAARRARRAPSAARWRPRSSTQARPACRGAARRRVRHPSRKALFAATLLCCLPPRWPTASRPAAASECEPLSGETDGWDARVERARREAKVRYFGGKSLRCSNRRSAPDVDPFPGSSTLPLQRV